MDTFVILRRSAWDSAGALEKAAGRSTEVGNDMPDEVRWIRSYVLAEGDEGAVGTVCIYQAVDEDAIRRHGELADLPVDEVIKVADTVIVRPDPEPAAA